MNNTLDIMQLIDRCPNAIINVQASDLSSFARRLVAESRQEFERERLVSAADRAEEFHEAETVKARLKVSDSTLYRWARAKILVPVWVGGQKRYRQSDIDRMVQGGIGNDK